MTGVAFFTRQDFLAERFDYRDGEHVTVLAPSGWGKTTLCLQLLDPLSTERAPAWVLMMKGRDETIDTFRRRMKLPVTRQWPPRPRYPKPRGWIVNPRVQFDPDVDEPLQYEVFRRVMRNAMKRGRGTKVFADEIADLQTIGLKRELSYFLRQARSLKAGMWCATQRPFDAPTAAYGQAMHLFIGNDPDKRSQDRYGEIGGVDRDMVRSVTRELHQFEWLYIRRARDGQGAVMCVVGA